MTKGKIKFIHMSDNHLGYYRFNVTNDKGINQRMVDFQDAFLQSVDLAIEAQPDFIINSGDIVDSANPPNRARKVLRQGLKKIVKAGIPMVVLSGTHDAPKTRRDSHVFELFNYKDIYMVTEPNKISFDFIKDHGVQRVNIFCVPHSTNFEEMKAWYDDTISEPLSDDEYNILTLHCNICGIPKLEYGYNVLDMSESVADRYDYVALGHFHTYTLWKGYKNVVFAGATEKKAFDEVGERRYIHSVDLEMKNDESTIKLKSIPLKIREMTKIVVDLLKVAEVDTAYEEIKKCIAADMLAKENGTMIQIVLRTNYDLYRSININYVKGLLPNALVVDIIREASEEVKEENALKLDISSNLIEEWKRMVNSLEESKEEKKWLWETGKTKLEGVLDK